MDFKEWGVLASAIKSSYKASGILDDDLSMSIWYEMLKDIKYSDLSNALKQWIMTEKFPPSIADLRNGVNRILNGDKLGEMEAWNMVMKAIRNSAYNAKKEFDALPVSVQKAVGGPETLQEWALSESFNEDVAMSHFIKAYKVSSDRETRDTVSAPALMDLIKERRLLETR